MNTHDMPPFHAFWQGLDIADRKDLGLIDKNQVKRELNQRQMQKRTLVQWLARSGWLANKKPEAVEVLRACLACLSASPTETLLINLEDLWLESAPQNVPGTVMERANWRRKARFTLEEIRKLPEVLEMLQQVNQIRRG